jgi:hypothetical protein
MEGELEAIKADTIRLIESHIDLSQAAAEVSLHPLKYFLSRFDAYMYFFYVFLLAVVYRKQ